MYLKTIANFLVDYNPEQKLYLKPCKMDSVGILHHTQFSRDIGFDEVMTIIVGSSIINFQLFNFKIYFLNIMIITNGKVIKNWFSHKMNCSHLRRDLFNIFILKGIW